MSTVFNASVVIGAVLGAGFNQAFNSANKELKNIKSQVKDTKQKLDLTKTFLAQEKKVKALAAIQRKGVGDTKELAASLRQERQELSRLGRSLKSYIGDTKKASSASVKFSSKLKELKKQQSKADFKAGRNRLGKIGGMALAAKGMLGGMVNFAADQEQSKLYLRTVINTKDGNKDRAVAESLKHAHSQVGKTLVNTTELLNIEYNLNSAGLDESLSRVSSTFIHKVAKVTQGEGDQVAAVMGVTFNNMADTIDGTAEEKMATIGNVLAKTQFKYQIKDFGQLGDGMKEAAASASAAKLPFLQTAAVIGQLNNAGVQGSSAGTALNATLRSLTKASKDLNFDIVRKDDGSLDLIKTLENLDDATTFMQTDEKSDVLQQLFGDEGKKGIIPLLNNIEQLKSGVEEIKAAGKDGLVNKEYDIFNNSKGAALIKFRNNLNLLGTVIGDAILPPLNVILSGVSHFVGVLNSWGSQNKIVGALIGSVVGGLIAMGATLAVVSVGQMAYNAALRLNTIGQIAYNAIMLLNPVGLIVVGIVAGFAALYFAWEPIKSLFGKLAGWAKTIIMNFTPFGLLVKGVSFALKGLYNIWSRIKSSLGKIASWFGFGNSSKDDEKSKPKAVEWKNSNSNSVSKHNIAEKTAATAVARNSNTTNNNNITIHQQPGEDSDSLADRVMEKINYKKGFDERNMMYDY